ncbi:MAG: TetR/AcrR family transcriptional regulator [Nitrospira sp.]|nr:TetR/AcrR family transcriptional regulator [Nitrospira sp.]
MAAPQMSKKRRGRPPTYDSDMALTAALDLFWSKGFAETSLDDISAATGMTRPSIYAAFGDKKALYRKALEKFTGNFLGRLEPILFAGLSLEEDLINFYSAAAQTYTSNSNMAHGCPVLCTAPTAAGLNADVQSDLKHALDKIDEILSRRFTQARKQGQLRQTAKPTVLAQMAGALLNSLSTRIRAGQAVNVASFIRDTVKEMLKK